MKRFIYLLAIPLLVISCGPEQETDPEQKLQELAAEKARLEKEIMEVRAQSEAAGSGVNALRVTTEKIDYRSFQHYLELTGSVTAEYDAEISPEINGQIREIHVQEGMKVNRGQLLISLNTDVTERTLEEIKTSLELAEKTFEKQKSLWEQEIGSELEYLQAKNNYESLTNRLETTQAQLDMAKIKAPFAGYVEQIFGEKGEIASPGMPLLHLVNLRDLIVETDVPENYLQKVREGDIAKVHMPALPATEFKVPVSRVGKVINSESRTFPIEMKMKNPGEIIRPNMITLVEILDFQTDSALVVPSIIVRRDIKGSFLFVIEEEEGITLAKKKYIQEGNAFEDKLLITGGLDSGNRVITEGFNLVSDGMPVSIVK